MARAEFIVYTVRDGGSAREVWRGEVSTEKWGPRNAFEKFVHEKRPPAGKYMVSGDQGNYGNPNTGPSVISTYELRYPDFAILLTDTTRLYGDREP